MLSGEEYNGYFIKCEPKEFGPAEWSIGIVSIVDRDGKPVKPQWHASFLDIRYETQGIAHDAGINAGKNWIKGLHPHEEFV